MSYAQAVQSTWAPLRTEPRLSELVRYATLAANSHNTQPWLFTVAPNRIVIAPDYTRRCPAVDPDDHHLFISLGCATENLVQAATSVGLKATAAVNGDTVVVELETAPANQSTTFAAIPRRQCTRANFDGKPVANEMIRSLEAAATEPGVSLITITERAKIANVLDYVIQGNTKQMKDAAFVAELTRWLRFNDADAVAKMDGLYAPASGNPTMPSWLARPLLNFFFTADSENKKYRAQIESSPCVAVFVSDADDKAHWVAVGRACQRFALQATAHGLKYAFINQPVEVPEVRQQFASFLGLPPQRRADLVVRFGYGPELPKSLRRPPEQVIRA